MVKDALAPTFSNSVAGNRVSPFLGTQCIVHTPFAGVAVSKAKDSERLYAEPFWNWKARPMLFYFRGQIDTRASYEARHTLSIAGSKMQQTAIVTVSEQNPVFKRPCNCSLLSSDDLVQTGSICTECLAPHCFAGTSF